MPIIFLTQGGGYFTVTTTGWAGTAQNDTVFGGSAWTNPTNAEGSSLSQFANSSFFFGGTSQVLECTNFGFTVPALATITGVQATIYLAGPQGFVHDHGVWLYYSGAIVSDDLGDSGIDFPATMTPIVYGGSGNLWGISLTPTIINDISFGIGIRTTQTTGGGTVNGNCYGVQVAVYYH